MSWCAVFNRRVLTEGNRILTEYIWRRVLTESPHFAFRPRTKWREGYGDIQTVIHFERTVPDSAVPPFQPKIYLDGREGGLCDIPLVKVDVGATARQFYREHLAYRGPDFCAEDHGSVVAAAQQLEKLSATLSDFTKTVWDWKLRQLESAMAQYHVTADSCFCPAADAPCTGSPTYDDTMSGTFMVPTGTIAPLTQQMLNWCKRIMLNQGAAQSAMVKIDAEPQLMAFIDGDTSAMLLRQNPEDRKDLHHGEPEKLLRSWGITQSYRGFIHVIDINPPRYNYTDGAWVRVAPFINIPATVGVKAEPNPAYDTAAFWETQLLDQEAWELQIPTPVSGPSPYNWRTEPSFLGEWAWKNIPSETCNLWENKIFPAARFSYAAMPKNSWRQIVILHAPPCLDWNIITSCNCTQGSY